MANQFEAVYLLLNPERIGHLLMEPFEVMNGALGIEPDKIMIFYPPDRPISNDAALKIVSRHVNIQPFQGFYNAWNGQPILDGHGREMKVFRRRKSHENTAFYFSEIRAGRRVPRFFSLTPEEEAAGEEMKRRLLGIPPGERFVCLHNREGGYVSHLSHYWSYRDAPIESYIPAMDYLLEKGFRVVRIGDQTMTPLPQRDGLIDLPFMNVKHGLLDIWLLNHCEFFLLSSSGPALVPLVFNGPPRLCVNFITVPIASLNPGDRYIPKFMRDWKRSGQFVTYNEAMYLEDKLLGTADFENASVEVISNSSEDILDAVIEMVQDLENGRTIDKNDPFQKKFFDIAAKWHELKRLKGGFDPWHLWGPPVGNRFLKKYPELLEGF